MLLIHLITPLPLWNLTRIVGHHSCIRSGQLSLFRGPELDRLSSAVMLTDVVAGSYHKSFIQYSALEKAQLANLLGIEFLKSKVKQKHSSLGVFVKTLSNCSLIFPLQSPLFFSWLITLVHVIYSDSDPNFAGQI